jgi:CubicO group peptidase (beta-lactamase class C family)
MMAKHRANRRRRLGTCARHFLLLVATATTARAQSPSRAELVGRIDSIANDFLSGGRVPSATIAVVRGRDTILMRGYGYADIATHRRAGPTTVYEIGSITKQFTASAIMRLAEQGKLSLDDDISTYLPGFPLQGHHVAIRNLLNHTSGIHNYTASPDWRPHWAEDLSTDSVVGFVKRDTFDFAPGTRWSYSNTGYVLLGMIVEKVSGKPYATYLDEQFFKPLGLKQTRYCPNHAPDTSFAAGYSFRNGALGPADYLSMTHPFSAGALCTSVRDYLVWQRALHGGRVVSPASYTLMTTPDTLLNGRKLTYGFGLGVGMLGTHRVISHGGGINGFTTSQLFVPDDTVSVIVFTNADAAPPDPVAMNIARAVLGMALVTPPKLPAAVALEPTLRDQVVGTYELPQLVVHIYVENGQLMSRAEGPGQGAFPLLYFGNDTFGAAFDPSLRLRFHIDNGVATSVTLAQGGGTMEGKRRP